MAAVSPTMLAVLTIGVGALILGIMIGMYTMPITLTPELSAKLATVKRLTREYYREKDNSDPVYRALIDGPNLDSIKNTLTFLSIEPHQAGTERDELLAKYFRDSFLSYGLDRAYMVPYKVLLSYANRQRPNKIYVIDKATKEALLSTGHVEPPVQPDEMHPNAVPAYNGFSPNGDVVGEPVYCNYGRRRDFELLEQEARIDLKDKVCIIRYGKIYRGNKVENAAQFGCAGVILFSDPSLMAPFGTDAEAVYPNSVWMNGKAMQRGNIGIVSGDILTEGFPSIDGGFRYEKTDHRVRLPKIPSQPIGYEDAKSILEQMGGISPTQNVKFQEWTGDLNITYRLGPGFMSDNKAVRMVINNELVEKTIYNVIGVLDGELEPDRYVIVGNHRDAWGYGAMDAASGGAAMLESAKTIGEYHNKTGWRPRRSLVFASWSGEELGLIGSTEYVEELRHLLAAEAVAYLNVDTCVSGPLIKPDASPTLMEVLRAATKRVPAHQVDKPLKVNQTLYDSWLENLVQESGKEETKIRIEKLSSGSDQVAFTFWAGVPSINIEFKPDKKKHPVSSYPAYHTGYETIKLVTQHVDPSFKYHQSCSRLASVLLYSLSCSTLIPTRFDELSDLILADYAREGLPKLLRQQLPGEHSSVELLETSMKEFANQSTAWHRYVEATTRNSSVANKTDPYLVRQLNDVSMRVERIFTENAGRVLFQRPDTRNLLIGSPIDDFYSTLFFPGLHDLLNEIRHKEASKTRNVKSHDELKSIQNELKDLQQELKRHLSDIAIAFKVATQMLRPRPI